MSLIDSILLVDDEKLFHLVFDDACSLLDISLSLKAINTSDAAEEMFKEFHVNKKSGKPDCVFVDLNLLGSSYDGIELIHRINHIYGNGVVIGIISSSCDPVEIDKSKLAGAQFWIVKSDNVEPRLEEFKKDFLGFKNRLTPFKVYK